MYRITIHTDKGEFEINLEKLQELDTILINYDGYDYLRAKRVEERSEDECQSLKKLKNLQKK